MIDFARDYTMTINGVSKGTSSTFEAFNPATREVIAQVQHAFADDAKQWREWSANIRRLSKPRAALDIAEFLLSI